ncbi:hypothetical protein TWF481_006427 [Arthrobotrys musiformis]|uniref:Uncharacterized protein n=1 Tax=Arthrobotrys musiformis TaxID=47236 RepID=A0AAV9WGR4_9PEZI
MIKWVDGHDDPGQASTDLGLFTETAAGVFIHEMMHAWPRAFTHRDYLERSPNWSSLQITDVPVRLPDVPKEKWPVAYGCDMVRTLACGITKPLWHPVDPSSNAETYLCYVLATWLQKRYGQYPYRPLIEYPGLYTGYWPYERSHTFLQGGDQVGSAELNLTARELEVEACNKLTEPRVETASFNGSQPISKIFSFGITRELCSSANWYSYGTDVNYTKPVPGEFSKS